MRGQGNLPRPGISAPARKRRGRRAVVRAAKRPHPHKRPVGRKKAAYAVQLRQLHALLQGKRRQNCREPPRRHRLPRPRRPDVEDIVLPCHGGLAGPPHCRKPPNLVKIHIKLRILLPGKQRIVKPAPLNGCRIR